MKKVLHLFVMTSILISCNRYTLSKDDLSWQPYLEGDQLVFESSEGELDTIEIIHIQLFKAEDDPLAIFPNVFETLYVTGKGRSILSIEASDKGTSRVSFNLKLGESYMKYPAMYCDVDEIQPTKNRKPLGEFTEYFKIKTAERYENIQDYPFDLRYIYWSNKYGYLGLEFKDEYIWSLKSFIRDGKERL